MNKESFPFEALPQNLLETVNELASATVLPKKFSHLQRFQYLECVWVEGLHCVLMILNLHMVCCTCIWQALPEAKRSIKNL